MSTNICPPLIRLFEEVITDRTLEYTPQLVAQEFNQYVECLQNKPATRTAKKVKTKLWTFFKSEQKEQLRQELPNIPRVSDFVVRWLGKDMRWWNALEGEAAMQVKYRIQTYCRIVKLNGAAIGAVNAGVIDREIAMLNKLQNGNNNED